MINVSFEENRIKSGHYTHNGSTANQLSRAVDELTKKCDLLISEYNSLVKRNQELRTQIEKQEKIKELLTTAVPQFFEVEMKKLQIMIDTYSKSLSDIEKLAEKTAEAIQRNET